MRTLNDYFLTAEIEDISTASSTFVAVPDGGRIIKIITALQGAISGGDAAISFEIGGTAVTGAAKGDMTGFTLELRAEEKDPLIWLPATAGGGTAKYPFDGLSDEASLNIAVGT